MSSSNTLIAFFVFAILAAYGVSRLLLFVSKWWDGGYVRILAANAASAALCIAVFVISKNHPIALPVALLMFGPSQIIVLLVDLGRRFMKGQANHPNRRHADGRE